MAEHKSIFRKQSIDRVSSPEQLNDYIRSASPDVWFIMAAVMILLVGVCVWGIFGHIDTRIESGGVCSGGTLTVYLAEKYEDMMTGDMVITVNDTEYAVSGVSDTPVRISGSGDSYAMHKAGLSEGDYAVIVQAQTDLPDGEYKAVVTVESIPPMRFVIN